MEIITREQAYAIEAKRYFTGRPCKKGHISERYTSNGVCCACLFKPVGRRVKVTYEVDRDDKETVDFLIRQLNEARGIHPGVAMTPDEIAYWKMVKRFRSHGAPTSSIPRSYRTFTLPEGMDP